MTIKINYKKINSKPSANLVLFSDDKFDLNNLKKYLSNSNFHILTIF